MRSHAKESASQLGALSLQPPFYTPSTRSPYRSSPRARYSTAPTCGPSRAGLLMGMYQQSLGMLDNRDYGFFMPPAHKTMPEAFTELGYTTGCVGKWNMPIEQRPVQVGSRRPRFCLHLGGGPR